VVEAEQATKQATVEEEPPRRRLSFGLDRFSGLYVWVVLIVVFALWVPDTFLRLNNISIIAGTEAITAMLALGIIIPLAAGVFDLSFAGVCGVAVAVTAWAQVQGYHPLVAAVLAIVVATLIGAINGFVVVRLRVSSFIATLGMSSLLLAAAYWITDGKQIVEGFNETFLDLGNLQILNIPLPFYAMLVLALIIYILIEYLPVGRYLYAAGGNPVAARLAGVRVDRIVFGSLVASSLIAGVTGVVLAARIGTASPDIGPSYLLPALSAVFLGSTQIRPGRVNVVGTLIAVYLLATGVKGLQLAGAPSYTDDLFNGAVLIIAVALAARSARRA
jgi:ribose transport system permease protein